MTLGLSFAVMVLVVEADVRISGEPSETFSSRIILPYCRISRHRRFGDIDCELQQKFLIAACEIVKSEKVGDITSPHKIAELTHFPWPPILLAPVISGPIEIERDENI